MEAVAAMRYPLFGRRGACPLVRANAYSAGQKTWTDYVETTRRNSLLCVLIEDPVGVANIEEILSVDGLSAVSFGPFDMSMESGDLGAVTSQVAEAELRIRAACLAHQVPFMNAVPFAPDTSADEFVRYREEGGRFAIVGNDLGIWARHCLSGQNVRALVRAKLDCASAKLK
jgi:2-keto-3-deoxy-L-rhamnonate aldolase RhmA